ncbi:MAG: hypothetical protein GDA50_06940 [Alphaproteobacteria bacterium GM202ARS2]|nr:hypothetical protein [Alphaproteobacteria bacterium GM202ARS2]
MRSRSAAQSSFPNTIHSVPCPAKNVSKLGEFWTGVLNLGKPQKSEAWSAVAKMAVSDGLTTRLRAFNTEVLRLQFQEFGINPTLDTKTKGRQYKEYGQYYKKSL